MPANLVAPLIAIGGALAVDAVMPLGVAAGAVYVVPVLLVLSARSPGKVLGIASAASAAMLAAVALKPDAGVPLWMVAANRAIALGALWAVALVDLSRLSALRAQQDAVGRLKILSGLIPICASCKRIRDDRGSWDPLEKWISEHSEAEFTHGICPECAERFQAAMKDES